MSDDFVPLDDAEIIALEENNDTKNIDDKLRAFRFDICQYVTALGLTFGVIILCGYKILVLPEDSVHFSLYFTPIVSLVSLWMPLKRPKKK